MAHIVSGIEAGKLLSSSRFGGLGAMMMSYDDAGTESVRRFEVVTGAGRRRIWTDEGKAEILAESYSGTHSISAVARRHGLRDGSANLNSGMSGSPA